MASVPQKNFLMILFVDLLKKQTFDMLKRQTRILSYYWVLIRTLIQTYIEHLVSNVNYYQNLRYSLWLTNWNQFSAFWIQRVHRVFLQKTPLLLCFLNKFLYLCANYHTFETKKNARHHRAHMQILSALWGFSVGNVEEKADSCIDFFSFCF